ncbi:(2Fe-2S)-binding protein [Pseudobacteriovorax antillogorgiicola]|uniref:Xanthine dehydrogenase YagT iron-sulfur-binding subunit n=1 Tax=Pseudobacteriovorax antillogorgiicola TaxID=1513793 RepID=A0A1Y6CCA7_9BACT|nr:2Fe-2S iron-sulfur cluster-binding protein [Pseudobacteriovorax antillogorgiicola]TCS48724.1 xanthine dehydrogenase YagT iron-sulfur-binding subunit [Pseudobacteriovorax antillogorgiicola]SMF54504.1 xanthine dehydrogenase YagT iron-sulfur-binding subunit [Pseudobacteriovorax antillogorgiicola]
MAKEEERRPVVGHVNRRNLLLGLGAAVGSSAVPSAYKASAQSENDRSEEKSKTPKDYVLRCEINGQKIEAMIDARTTLLDFLRENLKLTGTKKGCDQGACGACTIHIDGQRVLGCLTLAVTTQGKKITTIEGIGDEVDLHPMQEAFLRCDAYQCGYCTPGQIMSGIACIEEGHGSESVESVREWMSGNLCRCSAYPNITEAVRQCAGVVPPSDPARTVRVITAKEKRS